MLRNTLIIVKFIKIRWSYDYTDWEIEKLTKIYENYQEKWEKI
jgi:hypothetical protein